MFCASDTFRLMLDANDTGTDININASSSPAFSRSESPPSLDAVIHFNTHTHRLLSLHTFTSRVFVDVRGVKAY